MSRYCDETYDVYTERLTRARSAHECDACRRTIRPRDTYVRVRWVFDGSAGGVKRCLACQVMHEHLRDLGYTRELWPDERLACGLTYQSEWGAVPAEIAALPFLSADEVQALEPHEAWR